MEQGRFELVFPFGGLNDNEAYSDQPEGTTIEAVNVRPFDPKTGRRRGAQRAGTAEWSTQAATTSKIQSILSVPFSQERIKYTLQTTPTAEWTKVTPAEGTAHAITTDKNGYLYVYEGSSTLMKFNPDGTLLTTLPHPTAGAGTVVRIAVDEFGNVYAGLRRLSTGLVQKWTREEDDTYRLSWSLDTGRLRDIAVQNDILYCAIDYADYLTPGGTSKVEAFGGLLSGDTPAMIWEKSVPHPLHAIDVRSSGTLYFASPPNPTRGEEAGTGGFAESLVDWNPTDITNINGRLHYWLDAAYLEEQTIGVNHEEHLPQDIPSILTRADYSAITPGTDALNASDTTARKMLLPSQSYYRYDSPTNDGAGTNGSVTRTAPVYLAQSYGQLPSLEFAAGNAGNNASWDDLRTVSHRALVTTYNNNNAFGDTKASTSGALPENGGALPGKDGQAYIFAIVGQLDDSQGDKAVVFVAEDGTSEDGTRNFGLHMTANMLHGGIAADPRTAIIELNDATFHEAGGGTATSNEKPVNLNNSDGRFIVTVVVQPGTKKGAIRVNGRAFASFTIGSHKLQGTATGGGSGDAGGNRVNAGRLVIGGPTQGHPYQTGDRLMDDDGWMQEAPITADGHDNNGVPWLIGSLRWTEADHPSNDDAGGWTANTKYSGLNGKICEVLTVLADHDGSGGINNNTAALAPQDNAGHTCTYSIDGDGYLNTRGNSNTDVTADVTEVERIEGYLAHKWGVAGDLPQTGTDTSAGQGQTGTGMIERHPFRATAPTGGTGTSTGYDDSDYTNALLSKAGIVAKVSPSGDGVWAATGGGMGYAVKADEDGNVYTAGPTSDEGEVGEETVQARKIIDQGTTFSADPSDGAWTYNRSAASEEFSAEEAVRYPRIEVDSDGNLYLPMANAATTNQVKRLSAEGSDGSGVVDWEYTLSDEVSALGVALPPTSPTVADETITGPEFVYVATDNGNELGTATLTLPQIHKLRQLLAEENLADGTSSRAVKLIGVSGGDISELAPDGNTSLAVDALGTNTPFVTAVSAFGKGYFVDGINYKKYTPPTVATGTGTVETWVATKGEIPPRAKLVTFWRGRMVLARDPEDPQDWHMSALGDPDNWDKDPSVYTATMAISGNNARCGKAPDIVNAIIPYSDDLLLFGGDSNIYRLTGDPMGGGQMDTVTTATGIAYGEAWCKDPEGVVYFFGSRGGVYAMTPQGEVVSISSRSIEQRLQEIDLRNIQVKLVWSTREQGLYVYQVPDLFSSYTVRTSWFWDKRNNAWFEDEISSTLDQISAAAEVDGDQYDDRVLLLGTEQGKYMWYDPSAASDFDSSGAGGRISSSVVLGPVAHEEALASYRYAKIKAELARGQAGLDYSIRVGDQAATYRESAEAPHGSGRFNGGPNSYAPGTFKGASMWVRLSNSAIGERWALEALSLTAYPAGRKLIQP